jgi:hypothetical protein
MVEAQKNFTAKDTKAKEIQNAMAKRELNPIP